MAHYAKLVVAAIIAAFSHAKAVAGYANVAPPAGWGGSASTGWTFNVAKAANGERWVNGSVLSRVTTNVGGRMVTMPAQMRMAANAGQFVLRNVASAHPAGRAAMVVIPAVAAWLAESGIRWNSDEDQWEYLQPVGIDPTKPHLYWLGPGNMWHETALGACQASYGSVQGNGYTDSAPHTANVSGTSASCMGTRTYSTPGWSSTTVQRGGVSGGWFCPLTMQPSAPPPATCNAPAVEEEWVPGQFEPDILPRIKPLPDAVPNTAPDSAPQLAPPVDLPAINPDANGNPQRKRYPSGDPMPVVGSDPAEWRQPYIDVVPRPTVPNPWQVDMQPGEVTQDNPNANPDPVTVPDEDQSGVPRPATPSEDQRQLCDVYPDVVACQQLGAIAPEPLEEKIVPVAIEPVGSGGGGNCPAPRSASIGGKTYSFEWTAICDFATGIRPVVVAVAWLTAILSFMGLSRRD